MSIDKSELKILFLRDYGSKFDDLLEGARANLHRVEGSKLFGSIIKERLGALQERQQKLVEAGEVTMEQADQANKHYQTCINLVSHTMQGLDADIAQAKGRIAQLDDLIQVLKKDHDAEHARVTAFARLNSTEHAQGGLRPADGAGPVQRLAGERPSMSLKARRLAQAALDKNDATASRIQAAVEEVMPKEEEEVPAKPEAPTESDEHARPAPPEGTTVIPKQRGRRRRVKDT